MYKIISLFLLILILPYMVVADDYIDLVKKGNEAFYNQDFQKASDFYHSAETDLPKSSELEYNLAGTLYSLEGYEEAVERYTNALNTDDVKLEQKAHYNLGNTYFKMGDFQNAIKSYENALNLNPDDIDAKFNLELARKMLKEQIKPDEQQKDDQQQQQEQQQQ